MKKVRNYRPPLPNVDGKELDPRDNPFLPHPVWQWFMRVVGTPLLAVFAILLHILPIVLLICAVIGGTIFSADQWHLSLWLAVPVGLLVGVLFTAIVTAGFSGTLMEAGVRCVILLVLGLLLVPVFTSARQKAAAKYTATTPRTSAAQ